MNKIAAFVHIEKTGGTSLIWTLRKNFPLSHCDIIPIERDSSLICEADIRRAKLVYPSLRSFAAHSIKPFLHLGDYQNQLLFYTLLRYGTDRYISEYFHDSVRRGFDLGLSEWMKYSERWNFQTKSIAGENDLEAAKQIIAEKMAVVGVLEHYEEFVLDVAALFRPIPMCVAFEHLNKRGSPQGKVKGKPARVETVSTEQRRACDELNANDNALYEFAKSEIIPKQRARKAKLTEVECNQETHHSLRSPAVYQKIYTAYRNLIYKPSVGRWPMSTHMLPENALNVREYRMAQGVSLPS